MLKYIALSISFFILLSCVNYEYVGDPTTYEYDDCDYSDDKIIVDTRTLEYVKKIK